MEKDMKEMENEMKSFSYTFSDDFDGKGDSIRKIVIIHSDDNEGTDSIIEKGDCKIVVKTRVNDDGTSKEKNVEVFTVVDGKAIQGGDSTSVIVTMDGDNYTVKTIEKGQKIVMITSCKPFENLNETDKETLKSAGVKTKNNDLEIEDLKFAPNPSNGKFTLSFTLKEKKKVTINIYDLKGKLVYTETIKDFEGFYSKEIDISDQGTGAFFLQIVQGIYDIIKKIIIQ
jgi:flagellar hook assembly protein FlgD